MFTLWKKGPVRKVRQILDVLFGAGAAVAVLMAIVFVWGQLKTNQTIYLQADWPVRLHFSGFVQIPLTHVDIHRSAASQMFISAQPSSATLIVTAERTNFILVGFQLAWIILTAGTFFLIVYLLRKIFIHMDENNFFDHTTPAHLRLLGWVIIVSSLGRSLTTYLFGLYASSLMNGVPAGMRAAMPDALGRPAMMFIEPVIDLAPFTLFLGLVVFALAIAFQKGVELKQEQSLTV